MSQPVAALVASYELDAIEAYLLDETVPSYLEEFFDELEIPAHAEPSILQIAVAQILLGRIEHQLPQWIASRSDGEVVVGRQPRTRPAAAERLTFLPSTVFCINWADSGPGFSWPETYHVTYIPGFERYIVTASRDSCDMWGCADHAIGHFPTTVPAVEGARQCISGYWSRQAREYGQSRWAYLFHTGLASAEDADAWADEIWGPDIEPSHDDAEEPCDD